MPNAQPSPYSDTTTSPRPRTFGLMPQDVDRFAVHLDNGHGTGVPSIATCEKLLLDAAALVSMWIGDVDVLDQEGSLLVMEAAQALACGKGLSDFSKMLQEFARHRSDTFRAARVRAMAEAAAQSEAQPVAPTPPRGRVLHVVECWGNRDGRIFAGDELLTEQGHVLRVLRDVSLAESSVDVLAPVELALEENASGAPLAAGTRACWRTTRVGVAATVTIMAATITYVEAGTVPAEVLYKLVEMAKAEQEKAGAGLAVFLKEMSRDMSSPERDVSTVDQLRRDMSSVVTAIGALKAILATPMISSASASQAMDRVQLEDLAEAAEEPAFALRFGPFSLDLFVSRT
jgi:hypothetical protein